MSKKMGRPKVLKSKAKTQLRAAFFSPQEARVLDEASHALGMGKSEWIRQTTLNAAKPYWVISDKWGYDDLHDKFVQFSFFADKTRVAGVGKFWVFKHRDKVHLAIEIYSGLPTEKQMRIFLTQQMADSIRRHDDPNVADFLCEMAVSGLQRHE